MPIWCWSAAVKTKQRCGTSRPACLWGGCARGEGEASWGDPAPRLSPERIHFGGYLRGPGLVEAYRALDVAVWLREGNDGACRGVLEAMACGVPVIAGEEGAPAELVRDG